MENILAEVVLKLQLVPSEPVADVKDGKVTGVTLTNVPSFRYKKDLHVGLRQRMLYMTLLRWFFLRSC